MSLSNDTIDAGQSGARNATQFPPADALTQMQSLYDAGLNLQAYEFSRQFGPFQTWRGVPARVLAGRVALNVGGLQLGRVLHWLAWRSDRRNADLAAYHAYTILHFRGPLATYEFLERFGNPLPNAKPSNLVHFYTVRAMVAANLRDFSQAEHYFECAKKIDANEPWLATVRAHLYEAEDCYEQALEAARYALTVRPWYRPGVQAVAHALQLLDRDEEALAFLTEAMQHIENMYVARQLAILQQELGLYDNAVASLEKFVQLGPLMEENDRKWLDRQRIGLACARRDYASALAGAQQIQEPIYQELVQRLQSGAQFRRVPLMFHLSGNIT